MVEKTWIWMQNKVYPEFRLIIRKLQLYWSRVFFEGLGWSRSTGAKPFAHRSWWLSGLETCVGSSIAPLNMTTLIWVGHDSSRAYNDERGINREFVLNGLVHANKILEDDVFKPEDWQYGEDFFFQTWTMMYSRAHLVFSVSEYDHEQCCRRAFYVPNKDVICGSTQIRSAEKIRIAQSYKFSSQQTSLWWARAGLVECGKWGTRDGIVPYC